MRVLSRTLVVDSAERGARTLLGTYIELHRRLFEMRQMAVDGTIDLTRDFASAYQDDFEDMRVQI
jgi:hypothetical protein